MSHNLADVFEVADRIVVLRRGRKVADVLRLETNPEEIVGWITGAKSDPETVFSPNHQPPDTGKK